MTEMELAPCPFCGGEAAFGEDECVHDVVFAYCTRCAAQGPFDADKDKEEAGLLWNTREAAALSRENAELIVQRRAILAAVYRIAPKAVAHLCDVEIDRSGALLGEVREMAAALTQSEG